jgi:2-oxoisovalerate dehydrogenase E1 component alpha subunit
MTPGKDWALTYYRDIGVALTLGMTPRDLLLAHLARAESIESGGRNMPSHFSSVDLRIVSGSAPVATQVPHAVGIALASKMRRLDEVAVTYFGDGGASVGVVHESMNLAGVHKLAVIFVCENNQYAISVPASKQAAITDLSIRAQGYGFPGVTVDGNDVLAVYSAAKEAVERARNGGGPTFIEAKTYRFVPHTSDDDDSRYRSREEVEEWEKKGPLVRFRSWLEESDVASRSEVEKIEAAAMAEIDAATEYAEAAPTPDPATAMRHVFVEEE